MRFASKNTELLARKQGELQAVREQLSKEEQVDAKSCIQNEWKLLKYTDCRPTSTTVFVFHPDANLAMFNGQENIDYGDICFDFWSWLAKVPEVHYRQYTTDW